MSRRSVPVLHRTQCISTTYGVPVKIPIPESRPSVGTFVIPLRGHFAVIEPQFCHPFAAPVWYRASMLAPLLALALMQQAAPLPFTTGTELYQQCKNWVALNDSTRSLTIEQSYQAGQCAGYIDGLTAGLLTQRVTCPPSSVTIGTVIRVYIVYVDAHPKVLDFAASSGVYGAMKDAYPCPAK